MDEKPEILDTRLVAKSRLFGIEELHLRFRNGVERTYERLRTPPIAAVMMVPLLDNDTVLMIREYGAGTESYELTLPKGACEHGEDWRESANRELKEEAGHGAHNLTLLKDMTLSPGYMGHRIKVVLAEDLYEESLPGDEPEALEVVPWKLSELDQLIERDEVTEARVIAALLMTKRLLEKR
ncbi:MAG: ADP compounds hydrolase NudE [Pseudomonadota bacterium]|nr:ADP compounds hydrolase NudE [Pseudomonadota bacterium]MEE3320863.1 ADP compounds hydrolase NudE [Pseudomonadota bacterium]